MEQEVSKSCDYQAMVEVACPKCKQEKGKDCRTPKGRKARTHGERVVAYSDSIGNEEFWRRHSIQTSPPPTSFDYIVGFFDK